MIVFYLLAAIGALTVYGAVAFLTYLVALEHGMDTQLRAVAAATWPVGLPFLAVYLNVRR